jgi:orotidine-5'-phosphate decarboxylase
MVDPARREGALPMPDVRDRLIVALDLPLVGEARRVVAAIGDAASFYKIGYQLAYAGGPPFAEELIGAGKKVFLDLKLHDIANTVEEGVRSVARLGATFLTVHAYPQTMRAALAGRGEAGMKLLAVTVLTSYDDADAREAGYAASVDELVAARAAQARDLGVDGIVCAAWEAARVRAVFGPDRLIVTPGIRPAGSAIGDQKRVVSPAAAIRAGVDHIVVGRSITGAADPKRAAAEIVEEMAGAAVS